MSIVDDVGPEVWLDYEQMKKGKRMTNVQAARSCIEKHNLPYAIKTFVCGYYDWRAAENMKERVPDYTPALSTELIVPHAGHPWMLLADMHIPYHHTMALTHALAMAQKREIRHCILVGDTHSLDYLSRYLSFTAAGSYPEVIHELEIGYQIHSALCSVFKEIYVIKGNHDARVLKSLQKRWGMAQAWRVLTSPPTGGDVRPSLYDRYKVTERYYMILEGSPVGDWLICHQRNYSVIQGRVAQRLAAQEEINTVTSHEHGFAISNSGTKNRYYAVACPGMVDPKKTEYKMVRPTINPRWTVGWAVINEDGKPELYDYQKEFGKWGLGHG